MNIAPYGVIAVTARGEARYEAPALPYERFEEKGRGLSRQPGPRREVSIGV